MFHRMLFRVPDPWFAAADVKRERAKLAARRKEQDARDMETVGGMFDRMNGGDDGNGGDAARAGAGAGAVEKGVPPKELGKKQPEERPSAAPGQGRTAVGETRDAAASRLGDHRGGGDSGGGGGPGGAAGAAERRGAVTRRGPTGGGGLYDAVDAALPGYAFPMSGRRAAAPVVVADLAHELELAEEEEEEAARLARQDQYNAMLRAGTLRLADPDYY